MLIAISGCTGLRQNRPAVKAEHTAEETMVYQADFSSQSGFTTGDLGKNSNWEAPTGVFTVRPRQKTLDIRLGKDNRARLLRPVILMPGKEYRVRVNFTITKPEHASEGDYGFGVQVGPLGCSFEHNARWGERIALKGGSSSAFISPVFLGFTKAGGKQCSDPLLIEFVFAEGERPGEWAVKALLANRNVTHETWETECKSTVLVDPDTFDAKKLFLELFSSNPSADIWSINHLSISEATTEQDVEAPYTDLGVYTPWHNHAPLANSPNQERYGRDNRGRPLPRTTVEVLEINTDGVKDFSQKQDFFANLPRDRTLVRFLGGFTQVSKTFDKDLVYRDKDGNLQYRWDLLKKRLDGFVAQRTDVTIVLDDIPAAFPEEIHLAYGHSQANPPRDFQEWGDFVREMFREIKRLYGNEATKDWRVRVGTEMNSDFPPGKNSRFHGSREEYFKYHDYAAKGVKEIFPNMHVGPFNGPPNFFQDYSIGVYPVAEHVATGRNTTGAKTSSRFDFASVSVYNDLRFEYQAKELNKHFEKVEKILGHPVSREIHEWALLRWNANAADGKDKDERHSVQGGGESGIHGALWAYFSMLTMKEFAGIDRIYNWGGRFSLPGQKAVLPKGFDWLSNMLNYATGKQLVILNDVSWDKSHPTTKFKVALFAGEKRSYIVIGAWNHSEEDKAAGTELTIRIPEKLLPLNNPRLRQVSLQKDNCPHNMILADMRKAGQKYTLVEKGDRLGVGVNRGDYQAMQQANHARYLKAYRKSQVLQPSDATLTKAGDSMVLTVLVDPPQVKVIVVDN
jgi:hypothetical protein